MVLILTPFILLRTVEHKLDLSALRPLRKKWLGIILDT